MKIHKKIVRLMTFKSYFEHTEPIFQEQQILNLYKINDYLRWLETLFEKCEKNGFEHDIVDYYRVLKGKEYHSGMQK